MTLKTICKCDFCDNDLFSQDDNLFKITVEIFGQLHFCNIDCMRPYLLQKWDDMGDEKLNLKYFKVDESFMHQYKIGNKIKDKSGEEWTIVECICVKPGECLNE
jgi:hypothetical protein